MLAQQRQALIESMVKEQGSLRVSDLSEQFNVSQETIRRDIDKLQEENAYISKIHGGVSYISDHVVPSAIRKNLLVEEKSQLAKKAVSLIKNGDVIFLDCSTTSLYIAQEIAKTEHQVTIISNSSQLCEYLKGSDIKLVMIGGTYCDDNNAFTGTLAIQMLTNFSAHKCFISCPSVSLEKGLYDNSEDEASIRKLMMDNAQQTILVVDYTKFDSFSLMKISNLDCIDVLLTDKLMSEQEKMFCCNQNIKIM
ncbi:putative HTH-type transcriptional regulator YdjF [Vibrio stylophorae]|uniref:HTH-type transcriptional regulator YdjF n=1 Tax=Vibrio stylophorae TaxID=659351 RepID=A0ABN8DNM4_9VIBR|nr:DeoR/GlpR family DNA-binding transcription regulator [Vibrio stylophorae]CAH0532764.1 putative HTH-type transcriptional regulator YdjF [Vibrio stylophorae]